MHGQKYQLGFLLQIIYLKGSVLKLFTSGIYFFTTMRFFAGRVPCNSDTWHDVTRWQGRWDRVRKWWPARRDQLCWSTTFPCKTLPPPSFHLHYEIVEVVYAQLSLTPFCCMYHCWSALYRLEILLKTSKCFYLRYIIALFNIYSVDDDNDYIL